jgi:hypothetical protein
MTMTATPKVATARGFAPAGDYFDYRHDPSMPADSAEDVESEEYASPT